MISQDSYYSSEILPIHVCTGSCLMPSTPLKKCEHSFFTFPNKQRTNIIGSEEITHSNSPTDSRSIVHYVRTRTGLLASVENIINCNVLF